MASRTQLLVQEGTAEFERNSYELNNCIAPSRFENIILSLTL